MGQMAMATGCGGRKTAQTGGVGSLMGGRSLGMPMEDGKGLREGNPVSGEVQRVGDASGSASKGARGVLSDCYKMYCL